MQKAPVVPKIDHAFIKIKGPFILSASGIRIAEEVSQ